MNINKSLGSDKMHPRTLKELATSVSEPLTKLFNMSIQSMELPGERDSNKCYI